MAIGSYQQLEHLDIDDFPKLSTQVKVAESTRDLGVVLDSQLSLSSHVAALCRAGFFHLRQLGLRIRPSCSINDNHRCQAVRAFFYLLSSGLLQLHAVRQAGTPTTPAVPIATD